MAFRPHRMKFGIFMAPFHRIGENPTLALERDLDLVKLLDRLNFDEAWIGEHHSAGWELIADPALFIAAAAQVTRTIKLGTGVVSLPYHHPLMVADRMLQLDHMTRGRAMLGVGPGALTSDAYMMGIDPVTQRHKMDEGLEAIMALLQAREPVNMQTDWFTLRDARLQMASYTRPHLPIAVASIFSPAGPTTAGKHGAGLLSIAVSQPGGLISLPQTWEWVETAADKAGKTVNREDWRVVMPIHLADSREEAIADVEDRHEEFNLTYFEGTLGRPPMPGEETIQAAIKRGGAIVGTPDDAIETIERLLELSGGFGAVLGMAHEWTSLEKIEYSYQLWARYVAPHFQGQLTTISQNQQWVAAHRGEIFGPNVQAIGKAYADAGVPLPEELTARASRPA